MSLDRDVGVKTELFELFPNLARDHDLVSLFVLATANENACTTQRSVLGHLYFSYASIPSPGRTVRRNVMSITPRRKIARRNRVARAPRVYAHSTGRSLDDFARALEPPRSGTRPGRSGSVTSSSLRCVVAKAAHHPSEPFAFNGEIDRSRPRLYENSEIV